VRIVLLVTGTSLLTLTTSPVELTGGIERSLAPLARLRVPVGELAMTLTIALRFIPTTVEEADRIVTAQLSRGASFDRGGPVARARRDESFTGRGSGGQIRPPRSVSTPRWAARRARR